MQIKSFVLKNTSNITPNMFLKSVQNGAKSGPGAVPETPPKKSSKNLPKSTKRFQKSTKRLPKMTPRRTMKSYKTVWVAFFPHQKTMIIWKMCFIVFWLPPRGPRPLESSQNAIMECKNKGPTFSGETMFFYKN